MAYTTTHVIGSDTRGQVHLAASFIGNTPPEPRCRASLAQHLAELVPNWDDNDFFDIRAALICNNVNGDDLCTDCWDAHLRQRLVRVI